LSRPVTLMRANLVGRCKWHLPTLTAIEPLAAYQAKFECHLPMMPTR
jgi:hypothetical protein